MKPKSKNNKPLTRPLIAPDLSSDVSSDTSETGPKDSRKGISYSKPRSIAKKRRQTKAVISTAAKKKVARKLFAKKPNSGTFLTEAVEG